MLKMIKLESKKAAEKYFMRRNEYKIYSLNYISYKKKSLWMRNTKLFFYLFKGNTKNDIL